MKPAIILTKNQEITLKNVLACFFLLLISTAGFSQYNVTEIITDYGGYWKSSATTMNSVKPDNSHNLVSFSYNGTRYSTGVNDALLVSKAQSFVPGDYRALAVTSPGAANSNTKIGLGSMYDGVANGASTPAPASNMAYYLTDGIKGLDLGTCVANLPAGTLNFPIGKILTPALGDGIPDLVITQIADPSGSSDRYEFTDINGARIGNYVDIVLTNIPSVGNWTADFYEASKTPMTLASGFTKTDRPIRLWTSDLSAFGINASNASQVAYFKITLSGNSDVAFVSYNNNAINLINALLPVKLNSFTGTLVNKDIQLNWQTATETNSDAFVIERSADGIVFNSIGSVNAVNTSTTVSNYIFTDKNALNGKNYYRLKTVDKDGQFEYSKIIIVNKTTDAAASSISLYPNPAKNYVTINHPFAGNNEQLQIVSIQGNIVLQQRINAGSFQTKINLPGLVSGVYTLLWKNGKDITTNRFVVL